MPRKKLLLVGWDSADWKIIRPLVQQGTMPMMAKILHDGVHGNLTTLEPSLSPMLWTTIATGRHAATITEGRVGVLHGAMSLLLQDSEGQVQEAHSISAGLDYPGVGPEHSYLKTIGRAEYGAVTDAEALDALQLLCRLEGIIPALETAHAFAWLDKLCPTLAPGTEVVVNLSGRGDKDVNTVADRLGDSLGG
jgi:tryptophan synthase beta chain